MAHWVALGDRRVVFPNARTNQGTTPSDRRRRRSAPAVIRKRSWGIPAERPVVHRGVIVGKVRLMSDASQKSGGGGRVSMRIFPRIKKKQHYINHNINIYFNFIIQINIHNLVL